MEWKTIDSAPKDGTHVLLYSPDAMEPHVFLGYWIKDEEMEEPTPDGGAFWDSYGETIFPIDAAATHWMPLPEVPKN
jgi:hypothetical protein